MMQYLVLLTFMWSNMRQCYTNTDLHKINIYSAITYVLEIN
jgi:hypothetical protein